MLFKFFLVFLTLIINDNGIYQKNIGVLAENISIQKHNYHRTTRDINCFGVANGIANYFERIIYGEKTNDTYDETKIRFIFNSRDQSRRREFVLGEKLNLSELDFKVERRTAIIVHGFRSSAEKSWVEDMEKAYLLWNDVNLMLVDWTEFADTLDYYYAVIHTKIVGRAIEKVLNEIFNAKITSYPFNSINWGPIHMIGHSLGAQICGIAAKQYKKSSVPWRITRVTALDPARPCFEKPEIEKNVAPFVDVIHTNGNDEKSSFGLAKPIGHMDFYPNGGEIQLRCSSKRNNRTGIAGFLDRFAKSVDAALCSHQQAQDYFTESIIEAHYKNGTFLGHHWDRSSEDALRIIDESCKKHECPEMGINAENYPQRGSFFVKVSETRPYSDVSPSDLLDIKNHINIEENLIPDDD